MADSFIEELEAIRDMLVVLYPDFIQTETYLRLQHLLGEDT